MEYMAIERSMKNLTLLILAIIIVFVLWRIIWFLAGWFIFPILSAIWFLVGLVVFAIIVYFVYQLLKDNL